MNEDKQKPEEDELKSDVSENINQPPEEAKSPDSKEGENAKEPKSSADQDIQTENESGDDDPSKTAVKTSDLASFTPMPKDTSKSGQVCVTYGRDQIMNRQVVSLIKELGIRPIVMQDKKHNTIPLAQFHNTYPGISFVIAILSADDWVYPKSGKPGEAKIFADQKVVFHLGYWIGKLGRDKVFALFYDQRSFRWPTEHFDVIYTPLDRNDAWKKELKKRLTQSGITITEESF